MTKSIIVVFDPRRRQRAIVVKADQHVEVFVPFAKIITGEYAVRVVLSGKNASARIRGGGVLSGSHNVKLTVDTIHKAPDTKGSTLIRTVVKDGASLDFNGMIGISRRAQRSEDFLQQHSLLLSNNACATSVPALEIEANNVKASHAATVAPLDPEQLFYLRSRGISNKVAEGMVAKAFLKSVQS